MLGIGFVFIYIYFQPKKERKEYDLAISELNEYISNLKAKHGKLREFPPKTCFDATKNFDLDKIFLDPTGEGKPPCKYIWI